MKKTLLTTAFLVSAFFATAQTPRMLTFDEAVRMTMSDNPRITASQFEELAAERERKAAFGLRFPQIGVTGIYAHLGKDIGFDFNRYKTGVEGIAGRLAQDGVTLPAYVQQPLQGLLSKNWGLTVVDQDIAYVGMTAKLPIYLGGKINAANRAAKISEQTAKESGRQTKEMLMSELVERYYGLSLANQAVNVRRQVVDAMKQHLSDAKALEANGMIATSERLLVEVKLAEAERDLMDAQLQAETITSALSNTLNSAYEYEPVTRMFILERIPTLNQFRDMAMEYNPLLKQVELGRQLAHEGVNVERAELLPQVAALGSARLYNYNLSDRFPNWLVGATVSFKLFDGLHKENKLIAAKYVERQVGALEDKARKDIAVLVEQLYNQVESYSRRQPSLEKSLEFATEYLRVRNAGFREGVTSATDVLDAELNLAKTRIERLENAYNYDLALAKLLEAAGRSELFITYSVSRDAVAVNFE